MRFLKKTGAALLAVLLSAWTFAPISAYADETKNTYVRTVAWAADEERPVFDETITVEGKQYKLISTDIKEAVGEALAVPAEWTEWAQCAPSDLDATLASFPERWHFDQDGKVGDIPLTGTSYVAVEAEQTVEVNRTVTTSGLTSNDASGIPQQVSATGPSGNEITLAFAGLTWTVDATDEAGRPTSWTAEALYRGIDSQVVIDHYVVTATYAGEVVPKDLQAGFVATLTYEAVSTASGVDEDDGIEGVIAAVAAAAAALACIIGVPVWRRSTRARFTHVTAEDDGRVKRTIVGTAHVKRTPSGFECDAKDIEFDVAGITNYCAVEMPKKYVDPSKMVSIYKGDALVFKGPAQRELRIL